MVHATAGMSAAPSGDPNDGLAHALELARKGLHVFPIQPRSKVPHRGADWAAWQDYATTDRFTLENLWRKAGPSNPAVLMGAPLTDAAGREWIVVGLDVDERPEVRGRDSLDVLEEQLGPLPPTPRVLSGRHNGSFHLYFVVPASAGHGLRNIKLDPQGGVQLKAHHGYLVGPGAIHPDSGLPYLWEEGSELAVDLWPGAMPDRWLAYFAARMEPQAPAHGPVASGRMEQPGDHLPGWTELLTHWGATYVGTKFVQGAPCQAWLRPPGTNPPTSDHSAVVLDAGLWVYTDAWPTKVSGRTLEPSESRGGHTYSRIGFEAAMRHGDDSDESIRRTAGELRGELGLGPPASILSSGMAANVLDLRGRQVIDTPSAPTPGSPATPETPTEAITLLDRVLWGQAIGSLPKPEPLIDGYLDLNTVSLIYGPYGKGKSLLALDWALHVAAGRPWENHNVAQGRVVYLVAEGAPGMHDRLQAWCEHHLGDPNAPVPDLAWLPYPAQLTEWAIIDQFRDLILELRPSLVIIDTLARTAVGLDENSAKEMGAYVHALDLLRMAGAEAGVPLCVLPVHHAGKDNGRGSRGNTALPAATSGLFEVSGVEDDDRLVKLHTERQKDRSPAADRWYRITATEHGSVVLVPTREPGHEGEPVLSADIVRANVLGRLGRLDDGSGVPGGEWLSMVVGERVCSKTSFHEHRAELTRQQFAVNVGSVNRGRYRITPAGRDWLANVLRGL